MGLRDALLGGSNGKDDSEEDGYQDQAYRYDTTSTERVKERPSSPTVSIPSFQKATTTAT